MQQNSSGFQHCRHESMIAFRPENSTVQSLWRLDTLFVHERFNTA